MSSKNTKGARGSGTIRKRADGRWEARYTVGFDPETGKQKQKSIYGKTQKEVRQKLAAVTTELDDGSYLEPTKDSVAEWLDTWLKTYVSFSVKPYTFDSCARVCNKQINPMLGRKKLAELNPSDLCDLPRVQRKEIKPMEQENIARFMEAVQCHEYVFCIR